MNILGGNKVIVFIKKVMQFQSRTPEIERDLMMIIEEDAWPMHLDENYLLCPRFQYHSGGLTYCATGTQRLPDKFTEIT